ncbi:hypothetical protein C8Q74DRAFT_836706 [Fomes fomentarius]|nr:hypothetical protein C8Q74DRAFT_836706 [Fomes fomentarius]
MHFLRDDPLLVTHSPDQATAGPILVQSWLQYLIQGVIITQAKKFYDRSEDDPLSLRVYVCTLLVFSLLQTMLESYKVWGESIIAIHWWNNPLHFAEFLCNGIICTLCEGFLIRRCFRITGKNKWVLFYLAGLCFATLAANIILTVKIAMIPGPIAVTGHVDALHASVFAYPQWVYGTFLLAMSITVILSISLWRTRTGFQYLDNTLTHIIAITWETAMLPASCMLASAIIYSLRDADGGGLSNPSPLHLDLFFAVLTGKVYTLGLLRTLNSRTKFRERLNSSAPGRRSLSGYQWAETEAGGDEGARTRLEPDAEIGPLDPHPELPVARDLCAQSEKRSRPDSESDLQMTTGQNSYVANADAHGTHSFMGSTRSSGDSRVHFGPDPTHRRDEDPESAREDTFTSPRRASA